MSEKDKKQAERGRKGGKQTLKNHGTSFFEKIGKLGNKKRYGTKKKNYGKKDSEA